MATFRSALETFADAPSFYQPLDDKLFEVTDEASMVYEWETTPRVLEVWKSLIAQAKGPYLTQEQFDQFQDEVKNQAEVKGKQLFMPIRVVVIGKPHGTELKTLVPLIEKESLLKRAEMALNHKV